MNGERIPSGGLIRSILIALGAAQMINGLYALFAPRSFYEDFPFGRGWVEALPSYSEHLVRDVGGLFVGTAILLFAAAYYLERRLVVIASVSFLAFAVPHAIFHFFNLEPYGTGDTIANVIALTGTLAPIAILALLYRGAREARA